MNGTPHIHKIVIDRQYSYNQSGGYEVTYGDTRVKVHRGPWLDRRIRRGVKRAIIKHDKGSQRAAAKADRLAKLRAQVAELPKDAWGLTPSRGVSLPPHPLPRPLRAQPKAQS